MNRPPATLADRYVIEREVGRGGMATVYLARDLRHKRSVAIKILSPELGASVGAERFLREIHTAARLQHPHILPLHDSGEAAGLLYYVMPYVEGESLRNRLDRDRQLPVDEALRITGEVADALTYAHAHNVVHRDIKPENILLSGDQKLTDGERHALVTDFGVATAMSTVAGDALTQAGIAVGTPSYMSPEQATGDRAIDGRADTYALGCVLYEMLAGHPPFLGSSAREILARHAVDPVPPLRTSRPDLPEFIERAVMTALSKSPADRYATASALSVALSPRRPAPSRGRRVAQRLAYGAAAMVVVLAGYGLLKSSPALMGRAAISLDSVQSIAIVPFTNVGGDSTNEPFSDGMADELTTALGKIDGLTVTARTSAFNLKRRGLDPREIGRQLGVHYVVEGRVRRSKERRRVGVDLIDVATGREVWSDNFEHDTRNRDEFTVQDSITRSIVRQLLPHISRAAIASSARHATENPEAHDLYLQGRYFFERRDSTSLAAAQRYFERAISKDTMYALAYAGLSDAYSHQSVFGYAQPRVNFEKAKGFAARALALDSSLAEVHNSLGFIALFYDWDLPRAGAEFQRALSINPSYAPAHLFHAWYFLAVDSIPAAIREGRRAADLDPFSSVINTRLITFLFYGRQYQEALAQARKIFERDPNFAGVTSELARVYVFLGRCDEALSVMGAVREHQTAAQLAGVRGYVYAKCGRRMAAFAELDQFRAQEAAGNYVTHYGQAVVQAGLGNGEAVFTELQKALDQRAWAMFTLKLEPAFDPYKADPRFAAILRQVRPPS